MRSKCLLAFLAAAVFATVAAAQTKMSGTISCKKPDPMHSIDLDDAKGHAMTLSKTTCTWTKGFEIAGSPAKDGYSVATADVKGDKASAHGVHVTTMASGDKAYVRFQGTGNSKEGKPVGEKGTWSFTGGSGKLKGLKGKGTYEGKPEADGSMTYQVEGEYQLP
ncbi:MAG TPA: hypothetical protein VGK70_06015 [Thermoanaerobaculia bacterium]|jgi:hypothetical protein